LIYKIYMIIIKIVFLKYTLLIVGNTCLVFDVSVAITYVLC